MLVFCQGLNFNGADLSRLDLHYINFKMASLKGANLLHTNLSGANLERADLSMACLDVSFFVNSCDRDKEISNISVQQSESITNHLHSICMYFYFFLKIWAKDLP